MAKKKNPTPQEIYSARKQREEDEKNSLLPPGFVNHGNTCFMNSVLQGLLATQPLNHLVHSEPLGLPPQLVDGITPKRSPQITNGHGLGGDSEQEWVEGMPLGDTFLKVMQKAWDAQREQKRDSMTPKPVLNAIGKKYDQYLDFAQQDAHEFLRQLLDAMRMEEMDIIKKRQPPIDPAERKKRRRITPTALSLSSPEYIDEGLSSFVDMLFGGQLASVLVCQKCKHVSQTCEDFNDLSLSIKPEDQSRERKRDRLKMLAKKLTSFGGGSGPGMGSGLDIPRPSSVPPTPSTELREILGGDNKESSHDDRRKSWDFVSGTEATEQPKDSALDDEDGPPLDNPEKKEKKEKIEDGWTKIGRRLSVTVGFRKTSKGKEERLGRTQERPSFDRPQEELPVNLSSQTASTISSRRDSLATNETLHALLKNPEIRFEPPPASDSPTDPSTPVHSVHHSPTSRNRSLSPLRQSEPSLTSTTSQTSSLNTAHASKSSRRHSKSPRRYKPSTAEQEFIKKILSDIRPSSSNPFGHFRHHHDQDMQKSESLPSPVESNAWLKVGQVLGIEECLRMFTAVEILSGENMVGCRRCWKIANGVYKPKTVSDNLSAASCGDEDSDSETDSDEDNNGAVDFRPDSGLDPNRLEQFSAMRAQATTSLYPPSTPPMQLSASTPTLYSNQLSDISDGVSVASLPVPISQPVSAGLDEIETDSEPRPLPYISAAITNSPAPIPNSDDGAIGEEDDMKTPYNTHPPSNLPASHESYFLYPTKSRRSRRTSDGPNATDESSIDDESDTTESLASDCQNDQTSPAPVSSPNHNTVISPQPVPSLPRSPLSEEDRKKRRAEKDKQVIRRPAYKRYLIAKPPPVLVIHLKRFQQLSKVPIISFSSGLIKKIDDYVAFSEYLDLTPFLVPKKEDFGLKKRHGKEKRKDDRCLYRLYAVVVHLGNMLGGHYIAYTALPTPPTPSPEKESSADIPEDGASSTTQPHPPRQWAYISDTVVRLSSLEEVLKSKAYLCMYERI